MAFVGKLANWSPSLSSGQAQWYEHDECKAQQFVLFHLPCFMRFASLCTVTLNVILCVLINISIQGKDAYSHPYRSHICVNTHTLAHTLAHTCRISWMISWVCLDFQTKSWTFSSSSAWQIRQQNIKQKTENSDISLMCLCCLWLLLLLLLFPIWRNAAGAEAGAG